ncbi:MAG: hypothetical protein COB65_02660 [Thalassobium sp.]|nr:MAG: hypothetical protein COB65_02660 [Thalassobium sp.]
MNNSIGQYTVDARAASGRKGDHTHFNSLTLTVLQTHTGATFLPFSTGTFSVEKESGARSEFMPFVMDRTGAMDFGSSKIGKQVAAGVPVRVDLSEVQVGGDIDVNWSDDRLQVFQIVRIM